MAKTSSPNDSFCHLHRFLAAITLKQVQFERKGPPMDRPPNTPNLAVEQWLTEVTTSLYEALLPEMPDAARHGLEQYLCLGRDILSYDGDARVPARPPLTPGAGASQR